MRNKFEKHPFYGTSINRHHSLTISHHLITNIEHLSVNNKWIDSSQIKIG